MKKLLFALVAFGLAALMPVVVFAAPKKKGGKTADADITCASVWNKKAKEFAGKTVKTFVLDIGLTGTVMSDALVAVVPVETGDKSQTSGGKIFVLVPAEKFGAFTQTYAPKTEKAASSFGGKISYRKLEAVYATVGGEAVLLFGIDTAALKDFKPSDALAKQRDSEESTESSREGFEKKIFNVSKATKKNAKEAKEFSRLVKLYNRGKKKSEQLKEKDVRESCESDDDYSLTVFDEKAKIEWVLRN